jgi:hypothetical protein
MKATLNLPDDLMLAVKLRAVEENRGLTDMIIDLLRRGLSAERGGERPFKVEARPLDLRPSIDLTKALQLAADLEDEEIIRKLELQK